MVIKIDKSIATVLGSQALGEWVIYVSSLAVSYTTV